MRFSILILWLSAALEVLALNTAAPYEMMWLYSIYVSEWHVLGASGARTIATGCTHSASHWEGDTAAADEEAFVSAALAAGVTGICAFDEFVKFVGSSTSFAKYEYDTVGHTISPSWSDVAKKFGAAVIPGSTNAFSYQFKKLFPDHDFGAVTPIPWATVIELATDTLQSVRAAATAGDALIATLVQACKDYVRLAQGWRMQDAQKYINSAVLELIAGLPGNPFPAGVKYKPYKILKIPVTAGQITSFSIFDFEATIKGTKKNPSDISDTDKLALKNLVDNYASSSDTAQTHQDVMDAFQHSQTIMEPDITGCTPPTKRSIFKKKRSAKKPQSKFQRHLRQLLAGSELVRFSEL